jgi:DegV family protein with EDD domain
LDSQTVSVGLGLLVERAGELLQEEDVDLAEIVKHIRGMIPRIYVVIISHTLDYIYRSAKLNAMQAILGSMLKVHPFLEIEEGDLVPLEKSRKSERAIDKLVEFASEFARIENIVIFNGGTETTQEESVHLRSRLQQVVPNLEMPILVYDPIIASHVGPDAVGMVVYEGLWH